MTNVAIVINGTDRSGLLMQGTLNVSLRSGGNRSTGSFTLCSTNGSYVPVTGQTVVAWEGSNRLFLGTIDEVDASKVQPGSNGPQIYLKCLCVDLAARLDQRICDVPKVYENKSAQYIILDVMATFAAGEGITYAAAGAGGYVAAGATVDKYVVDHQTVTQVIQDMATLSGFIWYISVDGDLHHESQGAIMAPFSITDASHNFTKLELKTTREDYYNESWTQVSGFGAITDPTFVGDGSRRTWTLAQPAGTVVSVTLNGSDVSFGDTTGSAYQWSVGSATITQATTETVLASSDELVVTYVPLGADWVFASDSSAISARAAIEGNSGHYGRVFTNSSQTDWGAVSDAANAALASSVAIPRVITLEGNGFYNGAGPAAIYPRPGMAVPVTSSTPAVSGTFYIQELTAQHIPGAGMKYSCTCTDGQRLQNAIDFFKGLADNGGSSGSPTVTAGGTGGTGYTPPAAPLNITSATVVPGYVYNGNAASLVSFMGVITLPSTAPYEIDIVAVDPSGNQYPVQTIVGAAGATVNYDGITAALQPSADQTWAVEFVVKNSSGTPSASPYVTSAAVNSPGVAVIVGAEQTANRWAENNGTLHVVIQATATTRNAQPINLTYWKTGGSAGNQWLGWSKVTAAGQVTPIGARGSNMTGLLSPVLANETWQIAAYPGCIDSAAAIPSGAIYSAWFAVNMPANPAATVITGAYIDAITYGESGTGGTPFGWRNLYFTLNRAPNIFAVRFTVQTGSGTGSSFSPGGDHPNEDPVNYVDGHFYDVPTKDITSGSNPLIVPNGNNWRIPLTYPTHRIRVYAQTQAQASATPPTWTLQTSWSSGIGVSTPGTASYLEFVVDTTKVTVKGTIVDSSTKIPGSTVPLSGPNTFTSPANPGFESGLTGWSVTNGLLYTGGGHTGSNRCDLHPGSPGAFVTESTGHSCTPGDVFAVSAWGGSNNYVGATGTAILRLDWYNSSGAIFSSSTIATWSPTGWIFVQKSGSATAPTGAASVQLTIALSGETQEIWFFDDISFTRTSSAAAGGGLSLDANGNLGANLGYTMQVNSSGQIVLGNLPAVYGLPSLPSASYPQGAVILNTQDSKVYRNPTGSAWVKSTDPADLVAGAVATGVTVAANQVAAGTLIAGVVYAGAVQCSQLQAGTISAAISMTAPTIVVSGTGFTINLDGTNGLKVTGNGITTTINNANPWLGGAATGVSVNNGTLTTCHAADGMRTSKQDGTFTYAAMLTAGGGGCILLCTYNGNQLYMYPTSATSANSGSSSLPAAPAGFLQWFLNGSNVKIPYYAN